MLIYCITYRYFAFLLFTRAVHKESELFLFLIYCFTYNVMTLVSFKVLPFTLNTLLPFFPVLERVLERVLRDGVKVPCWMFFYLLYRLKSATFYWGFQLREQEKVRRGQILKVGQHWNDQTAPDWLWHGSLFCAPVSRGGKNFAATQRTFSLSVKIRWHELLQIPTS